MLVSVLLKVAFDIITEISYLVSVLPIYEQSKNRIRELRHTQSRQRH